MKQPSQPILLIALLAILFFIPVINGQTENIVWKDDMSYFSFDQFQTAGWIADYQPGVSFNLNGILLNATVTDTSIHYANRFPSGVYDWTVEDRSMWILGSHSGNSIFAKTQYHTYGFAADGWYSNYALYRDGQKILTFGNYQEQINQWFTLRMEKHGNQIDMYYNGKLEKSYIETDASPSELLGVSINAPYLGGAEYDYVQVWSTNAVSSTTQPPTTGDSWAMFGHDVTSARYSTSSAPTTNQVLWTLNLDDQIRTSVTISGNNAYVGSFSGSVYCLEASTGKGLWKFDTNDAVWSTPTFANGMVYVGSNDFKIYALNANTGTQVWSFQTNGGVFSSPTVVGNVVYVGSTDYNVYALDGSSGNKIWNYSTSGQIRDSLAMVDGVVYVGSQDGFFYAINAATGALIWKSPTGDGDTFTNSSPAVVDGVVYVGSTDDNLYAFRSSDGSKIWNFQTNGKVSSSPAVYNGIVYVGSEDGSIYAITSSSGTNLWTHATGGPVYSSPAIANGVIYVGSWDNSIYALNAQDGNLIWSYATDGGIFSSPSIAGGVMFVGSYDAHVYAFGSQFAATSSYASTSNIAKTAWVPAPTNGATATVFAVIAVGLASAVIAAATTVSTATSSGLFGKLVDKLRELIPETAKRWIEDVVSSKRKIKIDEKKGSPYLPTKSEAIVYGLSILLSTFAFSYVKINNFNELFLILPTFFATSILVSFLRTYILSGYSRKKGVWTEYKLWFFGLGLFILSTIAFRIPFSSPTKTVHHSRNFNERLGGFLSVAAILITLAFGGFFYILYKSGFVLMGGTGLAMCLISAFFDTFPIEPMSGKDVYKYNRKLWAVLFMGTLLLYISWIAQIL